MPSAGPRPVAFDSPKQHVGGDPGEDGSLPFVLVDVNRKVVQSLVGVEDSDYFKGKFIDNKPPADVLIGMGDVLRVTIFESGTGGLFMPSTHSVDGGNSVTIPEQEVNEKGQINVPYVNKEGEAGFIKVSGRFPSDVEREIQEKLRDRAIEPQVIVTVIKRASNLYSVIGEVNTPGRYNLNQSGVKILDAISAAGGPKANDYNTIITLQRGNSTAKIRMSSIMKNIESNIYVQPNDLIAVKKEDRYFNVLGATHNNNRIAFDQESMTVADALAKAGGLNNDLASAATVVVFRREEPKALQSMGVKLATFKDAEPIPTVYRFNFTEPAGLFMAQKMQIRGDDVVYVSSHPFTDASKLVSFVRDIFYIGYINNNN